MAREITVKIRGTRELRRALKRAGKLAREHLEDALNAGGDVFLAAAKANAPVRTGYLKEHLTIKTAFDDDKGVVVLVGGTIPDKTHSSNLAWWQEYGTSKQAAKPFMRPAFDTAKLPAEAAIIATLKRKLKL